MNLDNQSQIFHIYADDSNNNCSIDTGDITNPSPGYNLIFNSDYTYSSSDKNSLDVIRIINEFVFK